MSIMIIGKYLNSTSGNHQNVDGFLDNVDMEFEETNLLLLKT